MLTETGFAYRERRVPNCGDNSPLISGRQSVSQGKSVEYILLPNTPYWFPIRATYHRAERIYDTIRHLHFDGRLFQPYLPLLRKVIYTNEDFDNPTQYIKDIPLDPSLLFVHTTVEDFRQLLRMSVKGLTPFYNHFDTNIFGKNDFLIVPDRQMDSFRIIVESGNENIIVDQQIAPTYIEGDTVVVVGGPFAGVEGKVLKFKGQKRVFVEIPGLGCFGTAYVPKDWIRKVVS